MISAVYLNDQQALKSWVLYLDDLERRGFNTFITFDNFMRVLREGRYHFMGIKVIYRP